MAMLKEYNFFMNQRNKAVTNSDNEVQDDEEWITITDFDTGQSKRIKRMKSV